MARDAGEVMRALADPRRRAILARLAACRRGMTAADLIAATGPGRTTALRQLSYLRAAGLVRMERPGAGVVVYAPTAAGREAVRLLARWTRRLAGAEGRHP